MFLNIDPEGFDLLAYILTGVTSIISILFGVMLKAKSDQLKEKDNTLERLLKAKDDDISYKEKLVEYHKKEAEDAHATNMQLLAQFQPALKATQTILKDLSNALHEMMRL